MQRIWIIHDSLYRFACTTSNMAQAVVTRILTIDDFYF